MFTQALYQDKSQIFYWYVIIFAVGIGVYQCFLCLWSSLVAWGAVGCIAVRIMYDQKLCHGVGVPLALVGGILHMHWHKSMRYANTLVDKAYVEKGVWDVDSSQIWEKQCQMVLRRKEWKIQAWTSRNRCSQEGQRVFVHGLVSPVFSGKKYGFFDRSDYLRWQGIQGQMKIWHIHTLPSFLGSPAPQLPSLRIRIIKRAEDLTVYHPHVAGVYQKLVLGKGMVNQKVRCHFGNTGISHVLAVSGLHVSLLGGVIAASMRALTLIWGRSWYARAFMVAGAMMSLLVVGGYCWLCWPSITAVRATIAAAFLTFFSICQRQLCLIWASLGGGLGVLLVWPEALFRPGFQMSILCVLTLAGMHTRRVGVPAYRDSVLQEFPIRTLSNLSVTLRLSALTAVFASQIPGGGVLGIGVLANFVAIPLMGFVLMPILLIDVSLVCVGIEPNESWNRVLVLIFRLLFLIGEQFDRLNVLAMVRVEGLSWVSMLAAAAGVCWCSLWRHHWYLWGRAFFFIPFCELIWQALRKAAYFSEGYGFNLTNAFAGNSKFLT
ncbi:MAG: ComEC/Rec2 family competence protein [Alphaproteobacteria bacterium]|nr:MAG: ComEC/Rec2 family competence protein [Alphaproteobacteria bacterium]